MVELLELVFMVYGVEEDDDDALPLARARTEYNEWYLRMPCDTAWERI